MSMLLSLLLWTVPFVFVGGGLWVWQNYIRPPIDPREVIPAWGYVGSYLFCVTLFVFVPFIGPYPGH